MIWPAAGLPAHQLVVNWSPCLMCYGAVLWSGIRSLVIAGRGELRKRGVELIKGALREESLADFKTFAASGAKVYNPSRG